MGYLIHCPLRIKSFGKLDVLYELPNVARRVQAGIGTRRVGERSGDNCLVVSHLILSVSPIVRSTHVSPANNQE